MSDEHIHAKELIVSGTASPADERWLQEHLAACSECAALLDRAQAVRSALRSAPLMADPKMVDATRRRALRFAAELQERESHRLWMRLSIGVAAVLAWVSMPLLWQAAQWVGAQTMQPQLTAVLVFLGFGLLPALLAGAAVLAARQGSGGHQLPTLHSKGEL
jgi:anti-sigma factor RsiW